MQQEEIVMPNFTLGWELEAIRKARSVHGNSDIQVGHDASVNGEQLEYRLDVKAVRDPLRGIRALRTLCMDKDLLTDRSCGFHVHMGLPRRSRRMEQWAAWFVALSKTIETSAFLSVPDSRRENNYCRKWKNVSESVIDAHYEPAKGSNNFRYQWINPVEIFRPGGIRTVEIRLMGHTSRYAYLLSWIAVCRLMAQSSWRLMFDPSVLGKEKKLLSESFRLIRHAFITANIPTTNVVKLLCQEAGLLGLAGSKKKPLSSLREREDMLVYEEREAAPFRIGEYVIVKRGAEIFTPLKPNTCYLIKSISGEYLEVTDVIDENRNIWIVNRGYMKKMSTFEITAQGWEAIRQQPMEARSSYVTPAPGAF